MTFLNAGTYQVSNHLNISLCNQGLCAHTRRSRETAQQLTETKAPALFGTTQFARKVSQRNMLPNISPLAGIVDVSTQFYFPVF